MKKRLFLTYFVLFFSNSVAALQRAVVIQHKAVIFSDIALTSPIGYVSVGKVLTVGEVGRRHGTVLPIMVAGKVAYIQVKDLRLERVGDQKESDRGPKLREHNVVEEFASDYDDKYSENNFLVASVHKFQMGKRWDTITDGSDEPKKLGTRFKLFVEHRSPLKSISFGLGLSYFKNRATGNEIVISETGNSTTTVSWGEIIFESLSGDVTVFWRPLFTDIVSLDFFAGFLYSGSTSIRVISEDGETDAFFKTGLYGTNVGGQISLFPKSKFGLVGGISYLRLEMHKKFDYGPDDVNNFPSLRNLGGLNNYIGLSYKF